MKDKKTKIIWCIVGAVIIVCIVIALVFWVRGNKESKMEQNKMTAMYLTYGEGLSIFVETKSGMPFSATIPTDELYDEKGNQITKDSLKRGDVLDIFGNGIMLESYPGQYPGVTRMRVTKRGTDADADQYNELINQIYQKPDPSEPPSLQVEYSQPEALVSASTTRGAYEWNYTKEDGTKESASTDMPHILQWKEILDITLSDPTDLKLLFSVEPKSVKVFRWAEAKKDENKNAEPEEAGTETTVAQKDGKYVIVGAEPGYLYQVKAEFENGNVEYGFWAKTKEK